jgi:DNA-binding transcriptional LysR family regulator
MQKSRRNGSYFWTLGDGRAQDDFRVDPVLVANDPGALTGALICGEGLLLSGDVMIKPFAEQGLVRRVLAGWTGPEVDFNAVFPRGRVASPKVRAFVDFLVERLNFDSDYMMMLCPDKQRELAERHAAARAAGDNDAVAPVPANDTIAA